MPAYAWRLRAVKNTISSALLIITVILIAFAATFAGGYLQGGRAATEELENLKGKVQQQTAQAEKALADLTIDRDKKQAALDAQAKQQEETDNAAKFEIVRLASELERRPIRVRVVTEGGACGGSAASDTATSATDSTRNSASTSGLLPESNSRRIRAAIAEIETLSAAYRACRGRLLNWQ